MKRIIIPDVHGDMNRLNQTMEAAGFRPHKQGFRSEGDHTAVFLGDLIDNGNRNRDVVNAVRATVDDGEAVCLMGNHELNAIMMHSGFRERSESKLKQHAAFLKEFSFGDKDTQDVIRWFSTLPLRIQFGQIRVAHAFWGDDAVLSALTQHTADGSLTAFDARLLPELQAQTPGIASEVLDVTKGPEVRLPEGYGFADHYGTWRREGRMRWWGAQPETWEDAMISVHGDRNLPDGPPDAGVLNRAYPVESPLLFIGHYKMKGAVAPVADNVMCLDYPEQYLFSEVDDRTSVYSVKTPDTPPEFAF